MEITDLHPHRKVLDLLRVGATTMSSLRYETERNYEMNHLVHQLNAWVLTDHLVSDHKVVTFERPASWWDHLVTEGAEMGIGLWRWVARRWPPKTVTEERLVMFSAKAAYPQAMVALPRRDFGEPIIVETYTEESL